VLKLRFAQTAYLAVWATLATLCINLRLVLNGTKEAMGSNFKLRNCLDSVFFRGYFSGFYMMSEDNACKESQGAMTYS